MRNERACLIAISFNFLACVVATAATSVTSGPGLSVPDLIGLTRFGSSVFGGFGGDDVVVSPDGRYTASVLQRGILRDNTRKFSLLLLTNRKSADPRVLATFITGSNRPGIAQVAWLSADTLTFLGEGADALPQVYTLNIHDPKPVQRTRSRLPITVFNSVKAGAITAYLTENPPADSAPFEAMRAHGFVVPATVSVSDVIAGNWGEIASRGIRPRVLHLVRNGAESTLQLPGVDVLGSCLTEGDTAASNFQLSPVGDALLLRCFPEKWPESWSKFREVKFKDDLAIGAQHPWWLVLDLSTGRARPLTGGPATNFEASPRWSADGQSVIVTDDLLPIDLEKRITAQVDVRTGESRVLPAAKVQPESTKQIQVEEGLNCPWSLMGYDPNAALLKTRTLARETVLRWTSPTGAELTAGIYWPLNYQKGRRYSAVIQTHGFVDGKFQPDGYSTTGYAAQPLAASGMLVVQAHTCVKDCDSPKRRALTEGERVVESWQSLIDQLDAMGVIERNRVGLQGYSRSCFHQLYFLTHTTYPIAAMTCSDGVDFSYLQYLMFTPGNPAIAGEYQAQNNGGPYGENMKVWMERAAGFNLHRVNTPSRFIALTDGSTLLEEWEPYAGLLLQGKPAELFYIPDAAHNIVKPWERVASQQGSVDWFRFWLQGYERQAPIAEAEETTESLAEQYARWRKLREMQKSSTGP